MNANFSFMPAPYPGRRLTSLVEVDDALHFAGEARKISARKKGSDRSDPQYCHDEDQSYFVMYEHLTCFRFPNLVGGFDPALTATLKKLESTAKAELAKVAVVDVHEGYNATLAEGIQFAVKPNYPSFIKSVIGMSGYEPNGRWTEGENVIFTFTQNLPANFTLELDIAGAFGTNAGKVLQIQVGDWKSQFVVDDKPSNSKFIIKTSAPTDSIKLTIPEPKSPKDLGNSSDSRQLGISLKRLSIVSN
jgi:hypothetical protein